jgi:hypothetical protein
MTDDNEKKAEPYRLNNNLPTIYVDGVTLYQRQDGMYFIRLSTKIPGSTIEQARIMVNNDDLKEIVDAMCLGTGHYPVNKKKSKKKSP